MANPLLSFSVEGTPIYSGGEGMKINYNPLVKFGMLYNFYVVSDPRNVCAEGWHIPTQEDFELLEEFLGGSTVAGGKLKEAGTEHWDSPNTAATNEVGFNGRPAGCRNKETGLFTAENISLTLWSSTSWFESVGLDTSSLLDLGYNTGSSFIGSQHWNQGFSLRPLKDFTTLSHGETGIYVGNNGNVYPTICIGTQEWVAVNIMEAFYRNNDPIPIVNDAYEWTTLTTGAMCAYDNDFGYVWSDIQQPSGLGGYGILYNWYAATDARNICSAGWHLPTNAEFDILITTIGGTIGGGDKLKEISPTVWWAQSTGHETNEYGFNIRGAGYRRSTGTFTSLLMQSKLATYDLIVGSPYNYLFIGGNQSGIMTMASPGAITEKTGTSIRLLKDSTTLTHGEKGYYIGNDGKVYPTICIGTQEWLACNLAETKYADESLIPIVEDDAAWAALTTGACCAYDNNYSLAFDTYEGNVSEYGFLYNWYAIGDPRSIASEGWSVASCSDWEVLLEYIDDYDEPNRYYPVAGGMLKEAGYFIHWNSPNTGATNEVGFNVRGSGSRRYETGVFENNKTRGTFWCSDSYYYGTYVYFSSSASYTYLGPSTLPPGYQDQVYRRFGFSVRLKKDSTSLTDGETGTYVGNDGKVYNTICIGTQEWLSENLAETRFRYKTKVNYGALYNWYAATDVREIAAYGWHVPTAWTDWLTLINYLGGQGVAGGKIKEVGFDYWVSPNTGATNEVEFNVRGSGTRFWDGEFGGIMYNSYFWGTEEASPDYANSPTLSFSVESFTYSQSLKYFGLPIRLIKDSTSLSHGERGTYTGNDGTVYRTICIGTQEWLADNLTETKYRNGESIPVIQDNEDWAALITGAMCYYDNNILNGRTINNNITEITDNNEWVTRTEEAYCAYDNNWSNVSFIYTGLPSEWTEPKYLSIGIV